MLWDEPDPGWQACGQDCHACHVLAAGISQRDEIALRADLRYPWVPVELVGNRSLPGHWHHASRNAEPVEKLGVLKRGIELAYEREWAEAGFEARGHSGDLPNLGEEGEVGRAQKSAFENGGVVVDMEINGPWTNQRIRQLVIRYAAMAPRPETETGIVIVDFRPAGDDAVATPVSHD